MSSLTRALIDEIKNTPEPLQKELLDYLTLLKSHHGTKHEGKEDLLPLAQSAWASDWDSLEEDEAWRDL